MTSTLDTHQPLSDLIVDDFEGDELARGVAPEPGLQLPYLDLDAPGFTWPTHPPVGLPPRTPLKPAHGFRADEPGPPVQLKRDRKTLRGQADSDSSHPAPAPAADVTELPTRRSLRLANTGQQPVVRTVTMSHPVVPGARIAEPVPVAEFPEPIELPAVEEPTALPVETPAAALDAVSDEESLALAADLEAALREALEASPETEDVSTRQLRLIRALALSNDEPVEHLPTPRPVSTAGSEYASMLESYGPFPVLLPEHRDFRRVLVVSVLAGFLGADRFYERKYISGVLKLATAGGLGIWWIADIVAILNGRATDKDGHHYIGEKKHRAIAWALTAALFAGLTPVAATAAAPVVASASEKALELLFPKPAPVPTWSVLADVTGAPDPVVLDVTGERLRFTYSFPGPVYAYLQKDGDTAIPAEPLLLKNNPSTGQHEVTMSPGKYRLVVRADGSTWKVKAEELGLHG
jgi:hypothetical protein